MLANYVTVVEDRPIMSVKYCLPVPVFYLWQKLTNPAVWSLCDRWATCSVWRQKCCVNVTYEGFLYSLEVKQQTPGLKLPQ